MDDLVAFLTARYEEREARALAASGPDQRPAGAVWTRECHHDEEYPPYGGWPCTDCCVVDGDNIHIYDEGGHDAAQAQHIADNDPEFVLADIAAKRQIIELHVGGHECREIHTGTYAADWPADAPYGAPGAKWRHACSEYVEADGACETLRLLALPYVDHPDYQESWKP